MKSDIAFREELDATLHRHLTLSHPIFGKRLASPDGGHALLQKTALQGYRLTRHFLFYVEHLFFYCPLIKLKRALFINVYEREMGRLSRMDNHVRQGLHLVSEPCKRAGLQEQALHGMADNMYQEYC